MGLRGLGYYYVGNKDYLADIVKKRITKSGVYIEPFAGSFGCGFELLQKGVIHEAILNDIDPNVYTFWSLVKEHGNMLTYELNRVRQMILDFAMNTGCCRIADLNRLFTTPEDKALVHWWQKHLQKGGSSADFTRSHIERMSVTNMCNVPNTLGASRTLLKNVQIMNKDYTAVLSMVDNTSFVFFDPPYYATDNASFYDACNVPFDHDALKENIRALPCKWCLSYDVEPTIANMYNFADIQRITHFSQLKHTLCEELFISKRDIEI